MADYFKDEEYGMLAYVIRRLVLAIITTWAVSVISFVIIQLPPGGFTAAYLAAMAATGTDVSAGELAGKGGRGCESDKPLVIDAIIDGAV